ncbi:MAG: GH1 family beta-glucosidase [Xanthobacteraceae bacterium]|nr:GH1 family beta-glucosidase [Xanthobacteraceae bacterium]
MKFSRRRVLPLLAGLLGLKRAAHTSAMAEDNNAFPADFVWGASTSAYQIEGAVDADGRGQSIWDVFSHTPGRVKGGDTGDVACDHYHRWPEDVNFLASGGFNAYRFSTAWPRILPNGAGAVEQRGLDFYDRLVDGLVARGVAPWLCLYHWDLPQALQDQGGWTNRDIAAKFADYASIVARRLGDRVKHWAMFNEPNVHALFGYGTGDHAPGVTGLANLRAAIHLQNLAQGRALQALRAEHGDFRLGTLTNVTAVRPSADTDADRRAVELFDAYWNGAFLDPLFKGSYPAAIAAAMAPLVADGDLQAIRQPIDFFGLNYYAPAWVMDAPQSLFGAWFGAVPAGMRFTAIGWPIDAGGLTETLVRLRDEYGDPEIYVTENGACYDDPLAADGIVHDEDRIAYLREHLAAAREALAKGVKLRGYFVWSLMDNFEWAEGCSRRFGVIHVDFASLKRTPKSSFAFLAETIKRRR